MKTTHDAEDVLATAFFKIFKHLKDFKGQGSFEGWMKRIVVNEALMVLRKRTSFHLSIEDDYVEPATQPSILYDLQYADIIKLVDNLPTGYRTVFNMYAIEGYKHREIADILGISINTAKSQYLHAKKRLASLIKKKTTINKPKTS
jgi:RNA polymerase sigma-70 factor (ECF subfamily)